MNFERWKTLMESPETLDRVDAADVLPDGDITAEVKTMLLNALNDQEELVRACASGTLGSIDDDEVRQALRAALREEVDNVAKGFIASSLGAIGHLEDITLLVEESARTDVTGSYVRLHCAQAIVTLALRHSMAEIVSGSNSENPELRGVALARLVTVVELLSQNLNKSLALVRAPKNNEVSGFEKEYIGRILAEIRNLGATLTS